MTLMPYMSINENSPVDGFSIPMLSAYLGIKKMTPVGARTPPEYLPSPEMISEMSILEEVKESTYPGTGVKLRVWYVAG